MITALAQGKTGRLVFLFLCGFGMAVMLLVFQAGRDLFAFAWNRTDIWISIVAALFVCAGFVLGWRYKPNSNKFNTNQIANPDHPGLLLSRRENEVLASLLQNKSNKEICAELFIENSTLKTHVNRIYKKLHVQNRTELLYRYGNYALVAME